LSRIKNNGLKAYEYLRDAICKGELKPGSPVTEKWLGENLSMSRTPVREAMIRLQSEGLITVINNRAIVTTVSPVDIYEIYQLRLLLEPHAAAICIDRVDKGKVKEIRDFTQDLVAKHKRTFSDDIHDLHNIIIDSTGNKRLISIMRNLHYQIIRLLNATESIPGRIPRSLDEHLQIIDAILAGDRVLAEQQMRCHLESNMKDTLDETNYHLVFKA
jgi:DNA-binding GntR family transcriptional regulator